MARILAWLSITPVALVAGMFILIQPVSAYETFECSSGGTLRWTGQGAFYDVTHGSLETWWQNEIHAAADVWNASNVGADFDFEPNPYSDNRWFKWTRYNITDIAIVSPDINWGTCRFDEVDTYFNTRYSFSICDDCPSDTHDVRSVSIHEFGHWLHLSHVPYWKFWDWDCVMWLEHGTDYTLCDDDIQGIVAIYGAATN